MPEAKRKGVSDLKEVTKRISVQPALCSKRSKLNSAGAASAAVTSRTSTIAAPKAHAAPASALNPTQALRTLALADPTLGQLIRRIGDYELEPHEARNPYESLVRSIVYQQLHGKAAATILGRMKALYGNTPRLPTPQEILDTPVADLRAAGLSGNKTLALKDLAAKTLEGLVPTQSQIHQLADAEIIERLTAIRGIGPWTVEMMLIFQLGRSDVLPATDFGVRAGFALTYGLKDLPKPKELLEYGEIWRPYRSVASWYLWRATDLAKADLAKTGQAK